MSKRVSVVKDSVTRVVRSINELVGKQVLIGIPDSTTDRDDDDEKGPITNAALGYIHENGNPATNLPARPFLVPGVKSVEDVAVAELKKAAQVSLDGDARKADVYLNRAGFIGMNGAKQEISYANFEPLKPASVRSRRYARKTQSLREDEKQYLKLVGQGMSAEGAQNVTGIQPLINTGQLRNAINYVVRNK